MKDVVKSSDSERNFEPMKRLESPSRVKSNQLKLEIEDENTDDRTMADSGNSPEPSWLVYYCSALFVCILGCFIWLVNKISSQHVKD